QLAHYAFATPEALQAARARRVQVVELAGEVEAAQPVLAGLAGEEQAASTRAREASEWVGRLESIAVPGAVRSFAEHHPAAQAALRHGEEAVAAAEEALARHRRDHAAAEKLLAGTAARLETLTDQRAKLAAGVDAHPDVAGLAAGVEFGLDTAALGALIERVTA